MERRVKCANCGMVYDLLVRDCTPEWLITGECPNCKSNAYDIIPEDEPQRGKPRRDNIM